MALIIKLLEENDSEKSSEKQGEEFINYKKCTNPKCITSVEQELEHVCTVVDGVYRCKYCEARV